MKNIKNINKTSFSKLLLNLFIINLTLYFSITPAIAVVQKKQIVVIPVSPTGEEQKNNDLLKQKLDKALVASQLVTLTPSEKVTSYFSKSGIDVSQMTDGDKLLKQAEDHFYNLEFDEAEAVATSAIEELQKHPGILGGLPKAYLFRAQVQIEQNKKDESIASIDAAILASPNVAELDSLNYPPRFQKLYRGEYKKLMAEQKMIDFKVQVKGGAELPIYINGVKQGEAANEVITKVVSDQPLLLTAGNALYAPVTRVTPTQVLVNATVKGKNEKVAAAPTNFTGFKSEAPGALAEQALWLGRNVEAEQVVLLSLDEHAYLNRMTVTVVDVKSGTVTNPKQIDIVNMNTDSDTAASVASDYITKLTADDFEKRELAENPLLIGHANRSLLKKPLFWAIASAVVAAAVVGTVLALSGSDSSAAKKATSTKTTTTFGGDTPSAP